MRFLPLQGHAILNDRRGGLAVVLAAGNHSYIGLMDILEELFVRNRVAVLKAGTAPLLPPSLSVCASARLTCKGPLLP